MEPIPLLLVTKNPGKLREFRAALEPHGIRVLGLDTLPESGGPGVEETGSTFEENAKLKAEAYARRTDHPVLADDSGLEVDALGGEPGVHSARYGGPGLDDQQRVTRLLHNLRYVPDEQRTARFRCVLALARAGRTLATFDGTVEGTITANHEAPKASATTPSSSTNPPAAPSPRSPAPKNRPSPTEAAPSKPCSKPSRPEPCASHRPPPDPKASQRRHRPNPGTARPPPTHSPTHSQVDAPRARW